MIPISMRTLAFVVSFSMLPAVGAQFEITANPDYVFSPKIVRVQPGDTVHFSNLGGFHNVEADDGSFRCAEQCDDQGGSGAPSSAHWSFTRSFDKPGEHPYYCDVHGGPGGLGMSGMIIVEAQAYQATLRGAEQIPAIITRASGSIYADVSRDRSSLTYRLKIEGMDSAPIRADLHVGQSGANGGVIVSLCGEATRNACPASGGMQGSITTGDIQGIAAQGLAPLDMDAFMRALAEESVYVSVSSQRFPNGELRGQLAASRR